MVDEAGKLMFGDQLLAIYAREVLKDHPGATIIGGMLFGLSRRARLTGLAAGAALFLALAIAGDAALFLEGTGALLESGPHHHIVGASSVSPGVLLDRFLASRPRPAAFLALLLTPLSWAAGACAAASVRRFARPARP